MSEEVGKKADQGKNRWDLMPWKELEEVVEILTFGVQKYAENNWQKVPDLEKRYAAALQRHLVEYYKGNKTDAETGKSHLAHAICNCLFLMWKDNN